MAVNKDLVKRFVKDLEVGESIRIGVDDVVVTDTTDGLDAFVNIYTIEDPRGPVKITRVKGDRAPWAALQVRVLPSVLFSPKRDFVPHQRVSKGIMYSARDRELYFKVS